MRFAKTPAILALAALLAGAALPVRAEAGSGDFVVSSVEGHGANLARAAGARLTEPRPGQRLQEGNILSTGPGAFVGVELGGGSSVRLDERSGLGLVAGGTDLRLRLEEGQGLFEISRGGASVAGGGAAVTARDAAFLFGARDGALFLTVLSGEARLTVDGGRGESVARPGESLAVRDGRLFAEAFDVGAMSLFELEAVYGRRNELYNAGLLSRSDAARLPELIAQGERELAARRAAEDASRAAWEPPPPAAPAEMPRQPAPVLEPQSQRALWRVSDGAWMMNEHGQYTTVVPAGELVWITGFAHFPAFGFVWVEWERMFHPNVFGFIDGARVAPLHH